MAQNQRIQFAFFDSGTGGIPYMKLLTETHPELRCIYIADTKNFPYGEKTSQEIIDCSMQTSSMIISHFNPEVIVLACNTISVTALSFLRAHFSTPFIGTVPAIKLAENLSKNKRIGLLASKRTINELYTEKLIETYAKNCTLVKRDDGNLITYIEHNLFSASQQERLNVCKPAVDFFKQNDVDVIILACTHFIHFIHEIQELAGETVQVIDSRKGVIKQAVQVMKDFEKDSVNLQNANLLLQAENLQDLPNSALFVTGLRSQKAEDEYRKLCNRFQINFMGTLS